MPCANFRLPLGHLVTLELGSWYWSLSQAAPGPCTCLGTGVMKLKLEPRTTGLHTDCRLKVAPGPWLKELGTWYPGAWALEVSPILY